MQFADDVKAASGGKLRDHRAQQRVADQDPEIKRAVQTGQVKIGEILISVLANEDPIFAFDSNPFLAPTVTRRRRSSGRRQPYRRETPRCAGHQAAVTRCPGRRRASTPRRPQSLADLKGTKFRTYSPTTSRFAELIGAIPTTVQVPEVPQAFKTGLVDAMITSGATGVDTQAWDYLNYYYDTQAILPHNIVIVNKAAFAKLDPAMQKDGAGGCGQG